MSGSVLDASAVLAFLAQEPGADRIETAMDAGAAISALTVQEVVSKLVQRGMSSEAAAEAMAALGLDIRNLSFALAIEAGAMFPLTRRFGLSHGDRACLALGREMGVIVLTADRAWSDVADEIGVTVEQFR